MIRMLQFDVKKVNILQIGKLIAKYNAEAEISNQTITVTGEINNELLEELQNSISIETVRNYKEEQIISETDIVEEPEQTLNSNEYDAEMAKKLFTKKGRIFFGGIYLCNFNDSIGCEEKKHRPVVVIQENKHNEKIPTTIIIPFTTRVNESDIHLCTALTNENTYDNRSALLTEDIQTLLIEQIRVVDQKRLIRYLGMAKPNLMEQILDKVGSFLHINTSDVINQQPAINEKIVEKIVEVPVEKIVEKPVVTTKKIRQDISLEQLKMLQIVSPTELFEISKKEISIKEKTEQILELFGFDLTQNGVQYLVKAIVVSPRDDYFNFETLLREISKNETLSQEKIKNLIIARIKETMKFKKSPTIDFIRLVNIFLNKQEDYSYEENDI